MATYTNPWVGYIKRSYRSIKADLLAKAAAKVPELTDWSESNPLVIIIGMLAGLFEMLNLYIDYMAQESFIQTARRLSSMSKLVYMIDYRIKAANPSTTDVYVAAVDIVDGTTLKPLSAPYTIPALTQFSGPTGDIFLNKVAINIPAGDTGAVVPVFQITTRSAINIGVSDGITAFQAFSLGTNYVHGSSDITIGGQLWTEVTSFGRALFNDKVYIVEIRPDGNAYAIFGDNLTGAIPPAGIILADFFETKGASGNVGAFVINSSSPAITLPTFDPTNTIVYNPIESAGGTDYENLEKIRVSAPLSLRTLERAVTDQDYEDIARLCVGVGRAKVDFNCGKKVDIYVSPEGGGIANTALLNLVWQWFETRRMVTTKVVPQAAGETGLKISMDVTAKFRADVVLTLADVQNALIDYGAYKNQNINKPVKLSDIVAKVDNLPRVDYLTVTGLGSIPYARPINHTIQLDWIRETKPRSNKISEWLIEYDAITSLFRVFRDQAFLGNVPLGTYWVDPLNHFSFTINFGLYTNGMQWKFKTYPYNKDINLDDFTMVKVNLTDLTINVSEQLNPPVI